MKRAGLTRREFLTSGGLVAASFAPVGISGSPPALAQRGVESGVARDFSIFPRPQQMDFSEGHFILDATTTILIPANAAESDRHLARLLIEELSDRYDMQLEAHQIDELPESGRFILMGQLRIPW